MKYARRRSRARRLDEEVEPGRSAGALGEAGTKASGFGSVGRRCPVGGEVGERRVSICSKSELLGGGKKDPGGSEQASGGQLRRRAVKAAILEVRKSGSPAGELVPARAQQTSEGGMRGSKVADAQAGMLCPCASPAPWGDELESAVALGLSDGGRDASLVANARVTFGCPYPVSAPKRRSGKWSAHRLAKPTGCSRNVVWHGR
jgi:hypothetical protein